MKYVFYSSLIFLFYTHHAFSACKIVSYPQIIKLNKTLDNSIIKESDCNQVTQEAFIDFISSSSGSLDAKHLSHIFKMENQFDISFEPSLINVFKIEEKLQDLLNLGEQNILTKITSLYDKASIQTKETDSLKAHCNNCDSAGQKNIKLFVNNKAIWLTGQIYLKRIGFIVNTEINPFSEKLRSHLFNAKTFFDDGRSHLFKDIEHIQFYKTNKKLSPGDALKTTDLSPIALVKPGQRIKVVLKGANISLRSTGRARSMGKYGEFIEIYNEKTNKKVTAQVVDFNTVMVQL